MNKFLLILLLPMSLFAQLKHSGVVVEVNESEVVVNPVQESVNTVQDEIH